MIKRRTVTVLVVLLGGGRVAFGCSSDSGTAPAFLDAGPDVVADVATDRVAPVEAADPDPVPPPGLPEELPG